MISEIDLIGALQAAMEGYHVITVEEVLDTADIFITATGRTSRSTAVTGQE